MKAAIVTGASRGIGAATARLLASRGYGVAVAYRESKTNADEVVDIIHKQGGKSIAIQADMAVNRDILRLFDVAEKELGILGALVNNAAFNPSGLVEVMSLDVLESVFRVNVFGVISASKEALKRMSNGGAIVNVSSEAARFGGNNIAYYAASKAAVNTFTVAFAREAAVHNIRVNAVSPGVIDTDAYHAVSAEKRSIIAASIPMKRMGAAQEVAQTVAWLLSDEASYVSGSIVSVAGGR